MSSGWFVGLVIALALAIVVILLARRQRPRIREVRAPATPRDVAAERDGARRAHMNAADQAWEHARLHRHRDRAVWDEPPAPSTPDRVAPARSSVVREERPDGQ